MEANALMGRIPFVSGRGGGFGLSLAAAPYGKKTPGCRGDSRGQFGTSNGSHSNQRD